MAINPMQRKARTSFLLGMVITLVITGAIIAILILQLMSRVKEESAEEAQLVNVYVLNTDVKSGGVITEGMVSQKSVPKNMVPSNATMNADILEAWQLQDKEGNGIEIKATENSRNSSSNSYALWISRSDGNFEVKQEDTGSYYIEKNGGDKEYIQLSVVPMVAKVDLKANTVLTQDLISKGDSTVQDDVRKQEYNIAVLPADLETGDYVDIRIMFPNGQDLIVVSKKQVEIPLVDGVDSVDTFWVNLSEDEILHMSSAIIEAAKATGSKIYLNKYTDPGMQNAASTTYIVNPETLTQLLNDPNILQKAMDSIVARYNNEGNINIRSNINSQVNNENIDPQTNVETKMQESITNSKSVRKQYVESLTNLNLD